jgi:anhydro-N-acetylmuramic acid kinase
MPWSLLLTSFDDTGINIVATHERPYPETLRYALLKAVATPVDQPLDNVGSLDRQVGECFRDAALEVLEHSGIAAEEIRAIGSHGQTVRHQPDAVTPYTLQIGNPDLVAQTLPPAGREHRLCRHFTNGCLARPILTA